ncbi:VOC family protein [Spongiibacter sp.]|uniref:VOC family protein n=1 Tax=Spongiibacter sp. TaxID=2024860 RepID=UPI0035666880
MTPSTLGNAMEIGVVTNNITAMRQFYGEVLALPFESQLDFPGGSMYRYQLGGNIIKLVSYGKDTPQHGVPGGGHAACGYRYISFGVADLPSVIANLKDAGVEITIDVTRFTDTLGFAFVCDPDGNWIELFGGC